MTEPTTAQTPEEPEAKTDRQFVAALAKGLQVLRCFTAERRELGTAEIARLTGMPQPSVWRLCYTLLKEGYLVKSEGSDKLRPGLPVLSLGYAAISDLPISELAVEDMELLAHKYECAVTLGVPDGADIVYVKRYQGAAIVYRDLSVGSRIPVALSPMGWAYLAALGKSGRSQLLERERLHNPSAHQRLASVLPDILDSFRSHGYVVSKGVLHPQIHAIGMPIRDADGAVRLLISAGGIAQSFDDATLARLAADMAVLVKRLEGVSQLRT